MKLEGNFLKQKRGKLTVWRAVFQRFSVTLNIEERKHYAFVCANASGTGRWRMKVLPTCGMLDSVIYPP